MYRPEYPRPQFTRKDWINLNGAWNFSYDDDGVGNTEMWQKNPQKINSTIEVPFVFQSELSGIHCRQFHDVVWYERDFSVPGDWRGKRILLHFGAVDYRCDVYVNGQLVGCHAGGQIGFSLEITGCLTWEKESLTLRVEDPSADETIARGKQFWEEKSRSAWYTRSTGIWQTVWLEPVSECHLQDLRFTPDIDSGCIGIDYEIAGFHQGLELEFEITFQGEFVAHDHVAVREATGFRSLELFGPHIMNFSFHGPGRCWTPETPNLYDITVTLRDAAVLDSVTSYFGMRKIHTANGLVYLNNRPYYQRLVLDQGYWPESLLTAPSDDAFIYDITTSKAMGFNGCRKHQKSEDPRFLYWADKLGYLVWGEYASAPAFSERTVGMAMREWTEIIARDYNHPCIVTWVPLNESWGVSNIESDPRQQSYALALYHLIHALDETRLVVSNDGWEHTRSDLCTIHNYSHGNKDETEKFKRFVKDLSTREGILAHKPDLREVYARGFAYRGEPILLTEFGGMSFSIDGHTSGWGYSSAADLDEYVETYHRLLDVIRGSEAIVGFCYTQLTDVEQEINGLLTYDRKPKCDPAVIKALNQLVGQ